MLHKIAMTPAQIEALYEWCHFGPHGADVLIDSRDDGSIYVGQGDDRATIAADGTITEED